MGYNYRQELLIANKKLVEDLIKLADDRAYGEATFDRAEDAAKYQYLVNNLLRVLGFYYPGLAYVRNTIGTSVILKEGKMTIRVGPIGPGRRGRPPERLIQAQREEQGEIIITSEITEDTWMMIAIKLAAAKENPETRRIILAIPPAQPEGIQFIAEKLAPEFDLIATKPRMILERPPARKASP